MPRNEYTYQTREVQHELREGDKGLVRKVGEEGFVAGWASTSDVIDSYGTVIAAGAFTQSIAERGLSGPKGIKLLVGHNWSQPAGKITKLEQRDKGLWIEAQLDLGISYAKDMYLAAKANGGLSFSVGFRLRSQDTEMMESESGEEYLLIKKGTLREVSIVANPSNENAGMELVRKEESRAWRVGAARNLPVGSDSAWDGAAAKNRIFEAAGFNDGDPDPEMARRAFLVYDDSAPNLKGSYKLPFADVIGGQLRAMPAGLRGASSRLPQAAIPESVMARARHVLDMYFEKMERAADELTLTRLQEMLVEEGWVKQGKVEDLTTIVRAHIGLFAAPEEAKAEQSLVSETTLDNFRKVAETMRRLSSKPEGA